MLGFADSPNCLNPKRSKLFFIASKLLNDPFHNAPRRYTPPVQQLSHSGVANVSQGS
jgi:hypothetical protein